MHPVLLYPRFSTPSLEFAVKELSRYGIPVIDHPSPDVTHLLLDVPSFRSPGMLKCGIRISDILQTLPDSVHVIGGMLSGALPEATPHTDLLEDPYYLACNARITAACAAVLAAQHSALALPDIPILILGWGRIGKCLAKMLQGLGGHPCVLARKDADRALLTSLGYEAISPASLISQIPRFRMVINTVPALLIPQEFTSRWSKEITWIDLASSPGMEGDAVIRAKGLPGKYAPESSGKLIADVIAHKLEDAL